MDFLFNTKKERFTPVYLDSEQLSKYRTDFNSSNINEFMPTQQAGNIQTSYNNPYTHQLDFANNYYPIADLNKKEDLHQFVRENSPYTKETINGVPLKDYYSNYSNDVLNNGKWFLNKDLPQETKQYTDDSQVQQRMEEMTGLRQERDRQALGRPHKQETLNLFTPEERITGYGYQYSVSGGGGPGYALTRQKELEDYSKSLRFKNNEQPFEKIIVGKGIGMDVSVPAAGGFHEFARVMPENVSDYKANQLPGMVASGKWVYSNAPTSQAPVVKNRVNRYYSLCDYGPGPGRSTMTAEMVRGDYSVRMKNTNRSNINYGFGAPLSQFL